MKKSVLYSIVLFFSTGTIASLALYATTAAPEGTFGFIDETPVIFIVFGLLFFLFLWVSEIIIDWFDGLLRTHTRLFFQLLFAVFVVLVLQDLKIKEWTPYSEAAGWVKAITFVFPLLLGFRYLNNRYLVNGSFHKEELIKFLYLLIAGVLLLWCSSEIAFLVDRWLLDGIERKHNQWEPKFILIGFLFALAIGNLLNNLRRRYGQLERSERLLTRTKHKADQSKAALDALQASINPHFLYNALNSIAGLAKHDPEKTERMALALSSFYQYVTNKDQKHLSTVSEEVQMVLHYLEVEKIRFGDRMRTRIHLEDEARDEQLPHFTLQPIIENAIKYGFHVDQVSMKLEIKMEGSKLVVRIFDQGKPFDEQMSTGYGLKSVMEKLKLLYPERHDLAFVNTPEKHVYLSIEKG